MHDEPSDGDYQEKFEIDPEIWQKVCHASFVTLSAFFGAGGVYSAFLEWTTGRSPLIIRVFSVGCFVGALVFMRLWLKARKGEPVPVSDAGKPVDMEALFERALADIRLHRWCTIYEEDLPRGDPRLDELFDRLQAAFLKESGGPVRITKEESFFGRGRLRKGEYLGLSIEIVSDAPERDAD